MDISPTRQPFGKQAAFVIKAVLILAFGAASLSSLPAVGQTTGVAANDPTLQALIKAAQAEKTVDVYYTPVEATMAPVFNAFEHLYGIKVQGFHATEAPLAIRFATEMQAGASQADVLAVSQSNLFADHAEWFQKLSAGNLPNYKLLSDSGKIAEETAVGPLFQSFVVMYNTKKVSNSEVPRTWNDLTDSKWKGETLLADPRSSDTYAAAFVAISKLYPSFLGKVHGNQPRLVDSSTPAAQYLAAGTASIGFLAYATHAYPLMQKGAPLAWATIGGPELGRDNWVGAVRGPHPNAGRLFVNFFLSDDALKAYCLAPGVKTALDPTGKRTGCAPLSADVKLLPDTPPSKAEIASSLQQLGLQ